MNSADDPLLRDRDTKFTTAFTAASDTVFTAAGMACSA
jgi:hypothetical protein